MTRRKTQTNLRNDRIIARHNSIVANAQQEYFKNVSAADRSGNLYAQKTVNYIQEPDRDHTLLAVKSRPQKRLYEAK